MVLEFDRSAVPRLSHFDHIASKGLRRGRPAPKVAPSAMASKDEAKPVSNHGAPAVRGPQLEEEVACDERFVLRRARSERDGARVLVKQAVAATPTAADIALLKGEYELLASLPLETVTRPQALIIEPGLCALVFEDPGGRTLAELAPEGPPPLGWVLDYAAQLVAVLAELHRCGVVHRGIRPQAVWVEGPARRIRLADFSEAARGAAEAGVPLPPQRYRGRLAYAAPEHTGRFGRACDERSDFYSVGVLLYELLTGRLPFASDDALELIHAHLAKVPAAPTELNPAVPLVVSQIVMKLLAKAPEERYQSAACLQRDLQRCREEWLSLIHI